jgi:hypothetical protein
LQGRNENKGWVAKNSHAESGREFRLPSRQPEMIVVFIPTTQHLQPFGNRASSSWHHENSDCSSRPLRISLRNHALRLPRRGQYSYKPLQGSSKLFHHTSPPCESEITAFRLAGPAPVCGFSRRSPIISHHQRRLGKP